MTQGDPLLMRLRSLPEERYNVHGSTRFRPVLAYSYGRTKTRAPL
jgi:hypothetical protein